MNFLQYCLATKNYSAIDAVRCYAKNKSNVGKYIATGLGGAALASAPLGIALKKSNDAKDDADLRAMQAESKESELKNQIEEGKASLNELQDQYNALTDVDAHLRKEIASLSNSHGINRFGTLKAAKEYRNSLGQDGIDSRIYKDSRGNDNPNDDDYIVIDHNSISPMYGE